MARTDGVLAVNPGANVVLADTGPLRSGIWDFRMLASASVGLELILQLRDALNATTLWSKIVPVTLSWLDLAVTLDDIASNERVRLLTRAAVTGEVEADLIFYPRYRRLAP